MVHFRVFLGAPISADTVETDFEWQTLPSVSVVYPPATLDAASRRISLLYQNVLFDADSDHGGDSPDGDHDDDDDHRATTFVTWPATNLTGAPSFLRPSASLPRGTYETQETGTSLQYSDASSIARFPHFQFSLHSITPLSALSAGRGPRKVNVLLAALEVQGPDSVRVKKGADAGNDVSILKLILGDDQGAVCKLTAWRDTADAWGGLGPTPGITRGDILYFEHLVANWEPGSTVTLTASPYNKPTAEICYRTMPRTPQDNALRPDLRLGQSDAAVSRVAALVRWFENMAGLPGV